ncbi:MAG: hypothetical protein HYS33_00390 [Acidobacteria bacterium]|nr:hypothetical protein [Acidobacteriota bacterium]
MDRAFIFSRTRDAAPGEFPETEWTAQSSYFSGGCLQGHIKKALALGLTKHEISDAIVVAVGIAAAAMVDETDRAAAKLGLHHFE